MANRYFRNTGSTLWNLATNWSTTDGGIADAAVPIAGDAVFLTSNSGNCNINATTVTLASFNCIGYTGTLSGTFTLQVYGDVTFSPTMTITNTGSLLVNFTTTGTANLTSNGKTWTGVFAPIGGVGKIYNFVDNWIVQTWTPTGGTATFAATSLSITVTILGNMNTAGGATSSGTIPYPTIVLGGTGTISGAGGLLLPIVIDTAGTITFSGTVLISRSLVYNRGTIVTTSGTPAFYNGSLTPYNPVIVDLKGTTWSTIQIGSTSSTAIILFASGFTCSTLLYNTTTVSAVNIAFTPSTLYRITTAFTAILTDGNTSNLKIIRSSIAGTRASLTLDPAATCNAGFLTFTDIDASQGRAINVFQGVVSNCINVNSYNDPIITSSKSFVS